MVRAMRVGSVMALIGVIGCGGEGGAPLAPEGAQKVMAATIDGLVFTSDTVLGGLFGDSLDVTGYGLAGSIGLTLLNVNGPGTYSLEAQNWQSAIGRVSVEQQQWFLTSEGTGAGTVTLSTVTPNHVAGTFSFVAYDYSWDPPSGTIPVVVESGILDLRLP